MTLKRSFLALLLTVVSVGLSRGQAVDSPIVFQAPDAITTSMVDAPSLGRADNTSGGNQQWLKIEFHYAVAPKTGSPFLDSVEFRIWIEGRDLYAADATTAEGIAVGLTGTVTYLNLAQTKDGYGSFYVPPSALARYSSKQGISDFDRKFNIHIEAYVKGAKVDYFDKNKEQDPNWYQALRVVPDMVYRQDQCIFMIMDPSRYPQIKLPSK